MPQRYQIVCKLIRKAFEKTQNLMFFSCLIVNFAIIHHIL